MTLRPWIIAARPRTLPAAVVPVLVGSAIAWRQGGFRLPVFIAALAASVLIQIGTNYANDLFDYLKGTDKDRKGPTRVTQSGLLTPRAVATGTAIVFGLAALIGVYLVSVGGLPILIIGLLSILAGVGYTAGPYPLAYIGLGDAFAFLFFGVVATAGTTLAHTGRLDPLAIAASVPVGCLVMNIITVNNLRDIPTDKVAGKHTLAVRIGDQATRAQFGISTALAYAIPPALALAGLAGPLAILPVLTLP
ncbi:MAG: 1,4-dihydroxy-2-naphthoate polyprenyltransferase, partial [Thermoflexales bacterium]|nr:1,4-dihydroxy-2-naphthoate polyprenyltransferase [Thermoflexales bacterium]